jgi:hypothetical protein
MRIDALSELTASPAIMAAASVYGRHPAVDDDEAENQGNYQNGTMGVTGRSFIIHKSGRARYISRASRLQGTSGVSGMDEASSTRGVLDLRHIVKLLHLGANKLKILKLLRRRDWMKILRLLPKDLLVNALRLFSKEKLVKMMLRLPPKYTLKLVLQLFKIDELVKRMPTSQLMRILKAPKMDNRKLATGISHMEPRFIQLLMTRIYGGNRDYTKLAPLEIFKMLMQTDRALINESLKTMPFKALQPLVSQFLKKEPELLVNVSEYFIHRLMSSLPKPFLMKACAILPPEILMTMLAQLPNPSLVIAAAQVDDHTFEDFLVAEHGDLLQMLAEAA